MSTVSVHVLEKIDLLAECLPETLENLAAGAWIESHKKGTSLAGKGFQNAQKYNSTVYFVLKGIVDIYTATGHGSKRVIFFFGENQFVSQNILQTCDTIMYCDVIEDARFLCVKRENFVNAALNDMGLMKSLLALYERRLWRMGHQLKNSAGRLYIERKIAAKLWKIARDFGTDTENGRVIGFDMTITLLSDCIGATRETTSRACNNLISKGLLVYQNQRFLIPRPKELADFYKYNWKS